MFVNCLKMTSRIFLTALCLLTISFALASEEGDKDSTSLKVKELNGSIRRSNSHESLQELGSPNLYVCTDVCFSRQ